VIENAPNLCVGDRKDEKEISISSIPHKWKLHECLNVFTAFIALGGTEPDH
jgi:hypothetical protein